MYRTLTSVVTSALIAGLLSAQTYAQSDTKDLIYERRSLMHEMLDNYWPLFNIANDRSDDLVAATNAIVAIRERFLKTMEMFPEGTAKDESIGSRAKPEIWTQPEEFRAAADLLLAAMDEIEMASKSGQITEFKQRYQNFVDTCNGCHEFKPSGGGKFRFPQPY